ncbi:hypothetical protein GV792_04960 [Nocardia cyriacigeorgica]|uniref:tyrosine-type recombinase/integrase n=1 Tax=Nocardia cyriacigeorgica TaxID=135487 RepID=UPI0013BCE35D|nr:hypothetical protein [Nocardia cyriacigeorgica]NEW49394.1 hypothetical protein [Nocardia cyriacigeorgica]
MSIRTRAYKDGTPYFQVCYRIVRDNADAPTESSKSFKSYNGADRFQKLINKVGAAEAERIHGLQVAAKETAVPTVAEVVRAHIAGLTGIEDETRRKYYRIVDLDIDPFMGPLPANALTPDVDAAWVNSMQEAGAAPKTIANKHSVLSAAMGAAAAKRPKPIIDYNPCAGIRLPKAYGAEHDHLSTAEYELLADIVAPQWQAFLEFAVMSMARPSELAALLVGDIDRETGAVRITKAYKYANGRLKLGSPKSRRGVRTVYVPLSTVDRLGLDGRSPIEQLFATDSGGVLDVVTQYKRIWAPAMGRLDALLAGDFTKFGPMARWEGLDPWTILERHGELVGGLALLQLSPYLSRHTGISWRLQDGTPIWVVSRDAGHESITTTDKQYGHIAAEASRAAADTVSGRLGSLRGAVVSLEGAKRRRLVRAGLLGEIDDIGGGQYEAVWLDRRGVICSAVFDSYDDAVEHVALNEAGEPIAADAA